MPVVDDGADNQATAQVDEADVGSGQSEVNTEDRGPLTIEVDDRRPSSPRGANRFLIGALSRKSLALQVGQDPTDGRLMQPRTACQSLLGDRPVAQQHP